MLPCRTASSFAVLNEISFLSPVDEWVLRVVFVMLQVCLEAVTLPQPQSSCSVCSDDYTCLGCLMEAYVLQVFTVLLCIVCIAKCVQTLNCTCWDGEEIIIANVRNK